MAGCLFSFEALRVAQPNSCRAAHSLGAQMPPLRESATFSCAIIAPPLIFSTPYMRSICVGSRHREERLVLTRFGKPLQSSSRFAFGRICWIAPPRFTLRATTWQSFLPHRRVKRAITSCPPSSGKSRLTRPRLPGFPSTSHTSLESQTSGPTPSRECLHRRRPHSQQNWRMSSERLFLGATPAFTNAGEGAKHAVISLQKLVS